MAAAGRCRNGSTKLTAEQVVTIRQRRAAGASQKALAKQYDISDGQVSMIVRGIRWPNAGGPIETERKYCHVG
jgi:transcriptional regulator